MPKKQQLKALNKRYTPINKHTHTHDMLPETGPGSCASHDPHRRLKIPDVCVCIYIAIDSSLWRINGGICIDELSVEGLKVLIG